VCSPNHNIKQKLKGNIPISVDKVLGITSLEGNNKAVRHLYLLIITKKSAFLKIGLDAIRYKTHRKMKGQRYRLESEKVMTHQIYPYVL